ncbi:hypothetical protein [Streptomyces cinerochromogenes]|uniref:hypothetical protein n=1 Tax=Streptomyces cinerochromogenes TaxID=66422 RepID=UPI0016700DF3|nr:hypothetical protein [Streptomyces cinerochromogenes]
MREPQSALPRPLPGAVGLSHLTAYEAAPTRLGGFGMCGRRDEYALPGTTLPYHADRPPGTADLGGVER